MKRHLLSRHLLSMITLSTLTLGIAAAPAQAEEVCRVADPTGTPLNVRTGPNGRILTALRNGREVYILGSTYDPRGNQWVKVSGYYQGQYRIWGWVFRPYLNCYHR